MSQAISITLRKLIVKSVDDESPLDHCASEMRQAIFVKLLQNLSESNNFTEAKHYADSAGQILGILVRMEEDISVVPQFVGQAMRQSAFIQQATAQIFVEFSQKKLDSDLRNELITGFLDSIFEKAELRLQSFQLCCNIVDEDFDVDSMFALVDEKNMKKQLHYLIKSTDNDGAIIEYMVDQLITLLPQVLAADFELSLQILTNLADPMADIIYDNDQENSIVELLQAHLQQLNIDLEEKETNFALTDAAELFFDNTMDEVKLQESVGRIFKINKEKMFKMIQSEQINVYQRLVCYVGIIESQDHSESQMIQIASQLAEISFHLQDMPVLYQHYVVIAINNLFYLEHQKVNKHFKNIDHLINFCSNAHHIIQIDLFSLYSQWLHAFQMNIQMKQLLHQIPTLFQSENIYLQIATLELMSYAVSSYHLLYEDWFLICCQQFQEKCHIMTSNEDVKFLERLLTFLGNHFIEFQTQHEKDKTKADQPIKMTEEMQAVLYGFQTLMQKEDLDQKGLILELMFEFIQDVDIDYTQIVEQITPWILLILQTPLSKENLLSEDDHEYNKSIINQTKSCYLCIEKLQMIGVLNEPQIFKIISSSITQVFEFADAAGAILSFYRVRPEVLVLQTLFSALSGYLSMKNCAGTVEKIMVALNKVLPLFVQSEAFSQSEFAELFEKTIDRISVQFAEYLVMQTNWLEKQDEDDISDSQPIDAERDTFCDAAKNIVQALCTIGLTLEDTLEKLQTPFSYEMCIQREVMALDPQEILDRMDKPIYRIELRYLLHYFTEHPEHSCKEVLAQCSKQVEVMIQEKSKNMDVVESLIKVIIVNMIANNPTQENVQTMLEGINSITGYNEDAGNYIIEVGRKLKNDAIILVGINTGGQGTIEEATRLYSGLDEVARCNYPVLE